MFKPTFGQTPANPGFGSTFGNVNPTSPFGQSSFNKPQTAFGSTSAFGSSPASMFSSQPLQPGSLFGSAGTAPAFGQPQPSQPTFGFGATNTAASNPFGQPQQQSGGGLFGSSSSAFGQQNKPAAFSSFGTSGGSSLFGTQQSAQPTASQPFGAPSTAQTSGLFGQSTPFGSGGMTGTVIRFNPVTGTDSINKNNLTQTINTRHNCITCMKEYESKSLEELRLEDYMANRKGPQQGTSGLFGGASQQMGGGLFGTAQGGGNATAFGSPAPAFGAASGSGLFGAKTAMFGAPTTSSSPFSFGGPSTATPFGAPANKPFGAVPSTSTLFSTSAAQQTGAFGATGSTFGGFGTQATHSGTSFFGQPKPTVSFGTPSSIGTGFGVPPQQNTTNLFATKSTTSLPFGGSTFGATPAATGFGTGAFGQPQQQQQQQTTSLFGSFGKPTATAFGSQQIGAFGTQQPGSSLFANKPVSLFSQPTAQPTFGTTFGSNLNAFGTSSFGQNSIGNVFQTPQKTSPLILPPQPEVHEKFTMTSIQHPKMDILKGLSPSRDENLPFIATKPAAIDAVVKASLKVDTKDSPRLKLRMSSVKEKTLFGGIEAYDSSFEERSSPQRRHPRKLIIRTHSGNLVGKIAASTIDEIDEICQAPPTDVSELDEQKSNTGSNSTIYGKTTKILYRRFLQLDELSCNSGSDINIAADVSTSPNISVAKTNDEDAPSQELELSEKKNEINLVEAGSVVSTLEEKEEVEPTTLDATVTQDTSTVSTESTYGTPTRLDLRSTRVGYYTIPSFEELETMTTTDGKCIVDGFTVGRTGYGNIYFPDEFDVAGLDIDKIVHIRNKEVIVYPDEKDKPPVSQGLNRRAQITLDQVFPRDKTTHAVVSDIERLLEQDFEGMLRRNCEVDGSQFIEYRPETGSWVFKVEHFTRYHLMDEFSFIAPKKAEEVKQKQQEKESDVGLGGWTEEHHRAFTTEMGRLDNGLSKSDPQTTEIGVNTEPAVEDVIEYSRIVDKADQHLYGINYLRNISEKYHTSLIDEVQKRQNEKYRIFRISSEKELKTDPKFSEENECKTLFVVEPDIAPSIDLKRSRHCIELYTNRVVQTRSVADTALFQGHRLGVKWAIGSRIMYPTCDPFSVTFDSKIAQIPLSESLTFPSKYILLEIKVDEDRINNRIRQHLSNQLKHDELIMKAGNLPFLKPLKGSESLLAHEKIAKETVDGVWLSQYSLLLWMLMSSLWGESLEIEGLCEETDHFCVSTRRSYIEDWFEKAVRMTTHKSPMTDEEIIWNQLTRHELSDACESAIDANRHNLALLTTLIGSDEETRAAIRKQFDFWRTSFSEDFIDHLSTKIGALVAGIPCVTLQSYDINVCEHLSWVEAFAFHFWYLSQGNESVTDIVDCYEKAFEGKVGRKYAVPPTPIYMKLHTLVQTSLSSLKYDTIYHIFKLFGDRSYPLEKILDPTNHTDSPLDFSLSWFIMETLEAIGFLNLRRGVADNVHFSFAAQLERAGWWHWAVYVLLHIKDLVTRRKIVVDVIERNIATRDSDSAYDEKMKFVTEKLKVPYELFLHGEAVIAVAGDNYDEAIVRLIFTSDFTMTEQVFRKHIVPIEVINENIKYLRFLYKGIIDIRYKRRRGVTLDEAFQKFLEKVCGKGTPKTASEDDTIVAQKDRRRYVTETLMRQIIHSLIFNKRKKLAMRGEASLAAIVDMLAEMCVPSDYKIAQIQTLSAIHLEQLLIKAKSHTPKITCDLFRKKKK